MAKLIYGIGFNSKGEYKVKEGGRNTKSYSHWRNMLERCYNTKRTARNSTYIDCSIDERWHDLQDFSKWFYDHNYSNLGYQLDKDLLLPNNKIYSPDVCCFVPPEINVLLTDRRNARGRHPQGVSWHKRDEVYHAQINLNGKRRHLGYFDCPDEAYQAYKIAKEANVKRMALEWQDRIADNVFQALMNWQLTE